MKPSKIHISIKLLLYVVLLFTFFTCKGTKNTSGDNFSERKYTRNKNFQTVVSKAEKETDTIVVKASQEVIRSLKKTASDLKEEKKIKDENDKTLYNKINESFIGNSGTALKTKLDKLHDKRNSDNKEVQVVLTELTECENFLTVSNLKKLSKNIGEHIYDNYVEKKGDEIDSNDLEIIGKKIADSLNYLIEQNAKRANDLGYKLRLLNKSENSTSYEISFIEANTKHSYLIWNLRNLSHFQSRDTELPPDEERSRKSDYGRYIDSAAASIQRINAQYGNDNSEVKIKKVRLYVYIDGYADSENHPNNDSLSQERAKEIEVIFKRVFKRKMNTLKASNIIFPDPVFETKGHGEEKPKLEKYIDFKPDGQPDQNRRITIIKCIFYPEEN